MQVIKNPFKAVHPVSRLLLVACLTIIGQSDAVWAEGFAQQNSVLTKSFFDYDSGRKIINLGPINSDLKTYQQSKQIILQNSEESNFYKVIDNRKSLLRISIVRTVYGNMFAGIVAGIIPSFGRRVHAQRYVNSYEEAKFLPKPSIPMFVEEFDAWQIGDQVSYTTEGGVMLLAGAHELGTGVAILPLGVEGEWRIQLHKISKNHVIYSIERERTIGARAFVGNVFTHLSIHYLKNVAKSYAFKLDISHPDIKERYQELIRGRLIPTQKLAMSPDVSYIESIQMTVDKKLTKRTRVTFGIPMIVKKVWSNDRLKDKSLSYYYLDNENRLIYERAVDKHKFFQRIRNVFNKEKRKHLHKHTHLHQLVIAQIKNAPDSKDIVEEARGEILWSYTNDVAKKQDFERAIYRLKHFSGFDDLVDMQMGEIDKLGYVGIFYSLPFGADSLASLHAALAKGSLDLATQCDSLIDDYFKHNNNLNMCRNKSGELILDCVAYHKDIANKSLKKLQEYSYQYVLNYQNSRYESKPLAKLLVKTGRVIAQSPFVMQTLMRLMPEHFKAEYRVEGEKFIPSLRYISLK